jgi:CBS domain-containing protein
MKVTEVMSRPAITIAPDAPLADVARLLTDRAISGVPVVDEEGRCLGVLSETDLLVKQVSRPLSRRMPLEWIIGEHHDPEEVRRRGATTAREAMSQPPITIGVDRPVREAASIMVERDINRLPVLQDGRVVGIVTRADLVRAYLRLDEEIVAAVGDDVLRRTMWLDPAGFTIDVRDGIVRISGRVDRRSTARILEKLIGLVDGVVAVHSDLLWELDDSHLEIVGEAEPEPGAASLAARERPLAQHR